MNQDIPDYSEQARSIKVGHCYRHYKGGEYTVVTLARVEGVMSEVVVYQSLIDPSLTWTRPVSSFLESVECEGRTMPRFEHLGETCRI